MAPKRRQPHASKPAGLPTSKPAGLPKPLIFAALACYGLLIVLATLAITHNRSAGLPLPAISPTASPSLDPSFNYASGDFVVVDGWNGCKTAVKLAATSKADGTDASGTFQLTAVGGQSGCSGKASGRITCLLVSGHTAMFSGWLDQASDTFNIGNVLQGDVIQNDPQRYGPPVDRAFIGLADGSPECPPALSGPGGPQIISGTLTVSPAYQSAP